MRLLDWSLGGGKMRRCVMKEWWTCCSGEAGEREIVGWEWELV